MQVSFLDPEILQASFAAAGIKIREIRTKDRELLFDVSVSFGEPLSLEVDGVTIPFYIKRAFFRLDLENAGIDWRRTFGARSALSEVDYSLEARTEETSSRSIGGELNTDMRGFRLTKILEAISLKFGISKSRHEKGDQTEKLLVNSSLFAIEGRMDGKRGQSGLWVISTLPRQEYLSNFYSFETGDTSKSPSGVLVEAGLGERNRLGEASISVCKGCLFVKTTGPARELRLNIRDRKDEYIFQKFIEAEMISALSEVANTGELEEADVKIWAQTIQLEEDQ